MDAKIVGEDDSTIGVTVSDNQNVEHRLGMEFDGEIYAHNQDGYPDEPGERSNFEHETVSQARRFAKYHVYRERGYDVLPWDENPDRIATALLAIEALPDDAFEQFFDDFYRQVVSAERPDVQRVIEPPIEYDEDAGQLVLYMLDLYFEDVTDREPLNRGLVEETGNLDQLLGDETIVEKTVGEVQELVGKTSESGSSETFVPKLDGVSDIHAQGFERDGTVHDAWADDPYPDRDPGVRLQLYPYDIESLAAFRDFVSLHLFCQIRDCFVGMGVDPPEPFRVLGPGIWKFTTKYRDFDMYPKYYDRNQSIPGYVG